MWYFILFYEPLQDGTSPATIKLYSEAGPKQLLLLVKLLLPQLHDITMRPGHNGFPYLSTSTPPFLTSKLIACTSSSSAVSSASSADLPNTTGPPPSAKSLHFGVQNLAVPVGAQPPRIDHPKAPRFLFQPPSKLASKYGGTAAEGQWDIRIGFLSNHRLHSQSALVLYSRGTCLIISQCACLGRSSPERQKSANRFWSLAILSACGVEVIPHRPADHSTTVLLSSLSSS